MHWENYKSYFRMYDFSLSIFMKGTAVVIFGLPPAFLVKYCHAEAPVMPLLLSLSKEKSIQEMQPWKNA